MRRLVTLRTIDNIVAIENAQNIEIASVGGWSCIVKKGEFKVHDSGLFFEIDSWIPAKDERFEFLGKTKTYNGTDGWRIRTMKLRGALSQGLMLPLSMFPELDFTKGQEDYAEDLNVIKWDVDIASPQRGGVRTGNAGGKFPSFIPKTDEPRLQNLMHYFEIHKDTAFQETLKLDGSSLTAYKVKTEPTWWEKFKAFFGYNKPTYHFGVCSRNLELKRTDNYTTTFVNGDKTSTYAQSDFWDIAVTRGLEDRMPVGYAIQGELIGPKIQSNHERVSELQLHVFSVYKIDAERYLTPKEAEDFCIMYGIPHVPIVTQEVKIFQNCRTIDELQDRVTGPSMHADTVSEGRIYKAMNGSFSFKLISNEYLLKSGR